MSFLWSLQGLQALKTCEFCLKGSRILDVKKKKKKKKKYFSEKLSKTYSFVFVFVFVFST